MKNKIYKLFESCKKELGLKELSNTLGINRGTIKRWIKNQKVPNEYLFDFYRILFIELKNEDFSFKEKNQFFTPIDMAEHCLNVLYQKLEELKVNKNNYTFIEPSAGNGSFSNLVSCIAMDIEPLGMGIEKQDFLKWMPKTNKNIVIGNPPFGLRGHTALRFINHSANFADFVAFILPQVFDSDGKGTSKKRVKGLNLIYTEKLGTDFFFPNKKIVKINTIFQIWAKNFRVKKEEVHNLPIKIYSLSNGGTPSSTRNKKMLNACDIYLPSTCFGISNMKTYDSFDLLPNQRGYGIVVLDVNKKEEIVKLLKHTNWKELCFSSTNSAFNLRSSIIKNTLIKNGYRN